MRQQGSGLFLGTAPNQAAAGNHGHSPFATIITPVTVSNTATETVLWSVTIPANTLAKTTWLHISAFFEASYNTASTDGYLRVYYGGTLVATTVIGGVTAYTSAGGRLDADLVGLTAASQIAAATVSLGRSSTNTGISTAFSTYIDTAVNDSLAVTATASQALELRVKYTNANAGSAITLLAGIVTIQ